MSRRIILTKRAESKLIKLLEYLEQNWSVRIRNKFLKKLRKSLNVLKEQPDSFPKSIENRGLHRYVMTKQTTIYYRFDLENLYVITFFDTRQNPRRLKKEL
ncbi:type II toxin-antitoxin system RelE/ParE family toxin [Puteibacter caeruleilacunae]|nr:type II toxin-antitoxin system RelE/ParE family toxin [Puteibacter caeruleilacunae]